MRTGHTEARGTFLDVRVHAPEVLRQELERRRTPLPGLSDIAAVLDAVEGRVPAFAIEAINTGHTSWRAVNRVIAAHFPEGPCRVPALALARGLRFEGLYRH